MLSEGFRASGFRGQAGLGARVQLAPMTRGLPRSRARGGRPRAGEAEPPTRHQDGRALDPAALAVGALVDGKLQQQREAARAQQHEDGEVLQQGRVW